MIFYLTFGEQPSGVFKSQVEDVVTFMRTLVENEIKLVSFVSIRDFIRTRKSIKGDVPNSAVLPMMPGVANWKRNQFLLNVLIRLMRPKLIICRGVPATCLAIDARNAGLCKSVVYDGRGAVAAEWNEYEVVKGERLKSAIGEMERKAVCCSDKQVAVSRRLLEYWKRTYGFNGREVQIIPCTLGNTFNERLISDAELKSRRIELNIPLDRPVLVYSGSLAGWQSTQFLFSVLAEMLNKQCELYLVLLCENSKSVVDIINMFPKRVKHVFVCHSQVQYILEACDYGVLLRERSITNDVASPVKFAEYLASGLKVIISPHLGDYSDLVQRDSLGSLYGSLPFPLRRLTAVERRTSVEYAMKYFSKSAFADAYKTMVELNDRA